MGSQMEGFFSWHRATRSFYVCGILGKYVRLLVPHVREFLIVSYSVIVVLLCSTKPRCQLSHVCSRGGPTSSQSSHSFDPILVFPGSPPAQTHGLESATGGRHPKTPPRVSFCSLFILISRFLLPCNHSLLVEKFPPRSQQETHKTEEAQETYKTHEAPPLGCVSRKQLVGRGLFSGAGGKLQGTSRMQMP